MDGCASDVILPPYRHIALNFKCHLSAPLHSGARTAIPWGFLLLVPALAAAGGSGFALANGRRAGLVGAKIRRMPFIAANGGLVLIPSALFLAYKSGHAEVDMAFYAVQALERTAGAANITLRGLNMRDGLKMKGRLRRRALA